MITSTSLPRTKSRETLTVSIDGRETRVLKGTTVLEAARSMGIYIPTLCYDPDLKPYGACCLCVVEVEGIRGLPTSCTTLAADNMVVKTDTPAVSRSRRITLELIMANHQGDCLLCSKNQLCELQKVARYLGVDQEHFSRLRKRTGSLPVDRSHPAFERDPNKCILCGKCVRACNEIAGVNAIDIAYRGDAARVTSFADKPILDSPCESCGECLERCPTGALVAKSAKLATREVKTVCPYCGVGCGIYLGVRGNEVVGVRGDRENVVNMGSLCVKGRFGFDFIGHPARLTKPLIRREGRGKDIKVNGNLTDIYREASWEEALEMVAKKLTETRAEHGSDSIGVMSSAKCTNEENYLLQKFTRAALGTNNIDHCARLCHASTVVGAMAAFGSGAMSNSIFDVSRADLIFVIGSNTTDCHPVIGHRIRRAVKFGGTRLIVADPRVIDLAKLAGIHLRLRPGTDVALVNAMMNVIIEKGLQDETFIKDRTENFEALAQTVKSYTPEFVEGITGIPASDIVRAATLFAGAERAIIVYSMGITQHTTGTDNVKSVANLLLLTGNIGREGTGFSPLRGQNNVQGACDMGALPTVLPGYQPHSVPEIRLKFETGWGCKLSDKAGLTVTEMIEAASRGSLKALYIMGENPAMSEPDTEHARRALKQVDFLVVQDVFPTETAVLADVILPAAVFAEKDGTFTNTERRVQKLRKAVNPPGSALPDWQIICALASRMGLNWDYRGTAEIMEEIASLVPSYGGIHHDRLDNYGLQWPCVDRTDPGTPLLHREMFPRGLAKFHAIEYKPPAETASSKYPLVLTTGRILEHWHTGSMSRRSHVLETLRSKSSVDIHPEDALKLGIVHGDLITLMSERGKIDTLANITDETMPGLAFMAFHWHESPANVLTNTALDPVAKIPEYKVSAVKAVLAVLHRATQDNTFLARLADNPREALKDYQLTPEEEAALTSGDIRKIESWGGKLDERLKEWFTRRLQQEKW